MKEGVGFGGTPPMGDCGVDFGGDWAGMGWRLGDFLGLSDCVEIEWMDFLG